jgi:uncharacterized protein (DUF433 family)
MIAAQNPVRQRGIAPLHSLHGRKSAMSATIVNNRIAGTRITVWDVYHYLEGGDWTLEEIASVLRLTLEQVEAAVRYIKEHQKEVLEVHREIEERNVRGNPPEIEAMVQESHARLLARLEELRKAKCKEVNGEGTPRGC